MLGIQPVLGRLFRADEDRPGAPNVVLLSHDLWLRRYGGDRKIVGSTILVNAAPHTVVGVMPPRFRFPYQQDAWVPLTPLVHEEERVRALALGAGAAGAGDDRAAGAGGESRPSPSARPSATPTSTPAGAPRC